MIIMYRLDGLKIDGVQSYYDESTLKFDKNINFVIVNGQNTSNENASNGSGKSTLFKSISYGLGIYQKIPKNLIQKGKGNSEIDIYLSSESDSIFIQRILNSSKTISQDLFVSINGIEQKFQKTEYFKTFLEEKILGCNIDIFKYLRIFTQDSQSFLRVTNSEIIKIFEKLFNIDKLDSYHTKQNEKLQFVIQDIGTKEILIQKEKEEIDRHKRNYIKDSNNKDIELKINSIKNEIKEINVLSDTEVQLLKQDYNYSDSKYNHLKTEYTKLDTETNTIRKDIDKFNKLIQNKICPTCLRKTDEDTFINLQEKLIDDFNNLLKRNGELNLILKNDIIIVEKKLKESKKQIEDNNQQRIILEQKKKNLQMLIEANNNLITDNKNKIEIQLKERENAINSLEKELFNLKSKKNIYTYLVQIFSSKSKIRQNILVDILSNGLKKYLIYYSSLILNNSVVDFYFDDNIFNIGLYTKEIDIFKEYILLSQGERKKLEIIFILQMNDLIQSFQDVNLNLFIFDEFFDNLDDSSTTQVIELLNQYAIVNNQLILITTHKTDIIIQNCLLVNIIKENEKSKILEVIST